MEPVTTTEILLDRIATSLDRLVAIAEGQDPAPGTQDQTPTVSKAPTPAAPRKTASSKAAKTTAAKGRR